MGNCCSSEQTNPYVQLNTRPGRSKPIDLEPEVELVENYPKIPHIWDGPQITTVTNDDDQLEIWIFGYYEHGSVYKYLTTDKKFTKMGKYPHGIKTYEHRVISWETENGWYTGSFSGGDDQHCLVYNHRLDEWIDNIKYDKKKFLTGYELVLAFKRATSVSSAEHRGQYVMVFDEHSRYQVFNCRKLEFERTIKIEQRLPDVLRSHWKQSVILRMDDHTSYLLCHPFLMLDFEINDKFEFIRVDENDGPVANFKTDDHTPFAGEKMNCVKTSKWLIYIGYGDMLGQGNHASCIFMCDYNKDQNYKFRRVDIKNDYKFQNTGAFSIQNDILHVIGGKAEKKHVVYNIEYLAQNLEKNPVN